MSRTNAPSIVQRFSDEYLERCRELSPQDIVRFLEDYRKLFGAARRNCGRREQNASDTRKTAPK